MGKYIEFRKELENNKAERACVIPLHELPNKVDPYKDCYRSLFFYNEEILKHITDKGTVAGFRGKAGIDRLVWDFDHSDLEIARKDSLELIKRLNLKYDIQNNEIGIFFSGRKGFAIELKCDRIKGLDGVLDENVPIYIKKLCIKIGGDLESCDRVIYNHNRLYRIAGTLHQKETSLENGTIRLFKTSLPFDMLATSSIESIKKYAMSLRVPETFDKIANATKISEEIQYIIEHIDEISRSLPEAPKVQDGMVLDDSLAPRNYKTCIWRLCQGAYTVGRDNALLRVADHEHKLKMPATVIKSTLRGVLDLMNEADPAKAQLDPMGDNDLDRIVRQVLNNDYDFGCYDPVLDSQCSKKCFLAHRKFTESKAETVTLLDAYVRSKSFYQKYYENIVPTGLKAIDDSMPLFNGTLNLIVGKPGTGKTSLMLNIMKHASDHNIPALFFSLDMSEEMLIQRCAPILLADKQGEPFISGKDFMQAHARNDVKLMDKALEAFEEVSKNVLISSQRSMTVSDIADEIDRQEARWGRKVKLVIVDYVQLLRSDKEGFANHEFNAEALAEISKNKKVCLLGLSQAVGNYDDANILAKGSRAWEEQASTQVNCFRPFKETNAEYDYIMSIRMAKNRLGDTATIDLFFNGPSGFIRDLKEHEELEIKALKDRIDHDSN